MNDIFWVMLLKPIFAIAFLSAVFYMKNVIMRRLKDGRLKRVLSIHLWNTDFDNSHEKKKRQD